MTIPPIEEITGTSPCPCTSGKAWRKCCGKYSTAESVQVQRTVTPGTTAILFVLAKVQANEVYTDDNNIVPVFKDRAQAIALNEKLGYAYQIVGMNVDGWAKFQAAGVDFMVISDAVA